MAGLRGGRGGDAYCRCEGEEDEDDAEDSEGSAGFGLGDGGWVCWVRKGFDETRESDPCLSGSGWESDCWRLGPGVDKERLKGLEPGTCGAVRGGRDGVGVVADLRAKSLERRGGGGSADFADKG